MDLEEKLIRFINNKLELNKVFVALKLHLLLRLLRVLGKSRLTEENN